MEKNAGRNLEYGPRTRLVRGMYNNGETLFNLIPKGSIYEHANENDNWDCFTSVPEVF